MKITTRRDALFAQLQTVTRAASTRSAVQALSGVQLQARDGAIELRATDMEIGLRVPLDGEVVRDGAVVLPARLLVDVVRALPADDVSLELRPAEQDVELVGGAATFHIRTLRLEDFPPLPGGRRATAASRSRAPAFVETVLKVARSASRDETRPVLTGILVSASGDELRMVATDSYRLASRRRSSSAARRRVRGQRAGPRAAGADADRPARGRRAARACRCAPTRSSSRPAGVVLSSRLIDGQFPNYRQLLPDAYEHELQLAGDGDHRRRAPHLAARAEERAAAAGVRRGRADGVGAHAGRRRGARDAARPVPGRAAGDRLQPRVPARRPGDAWRAATCC